MVDNSGLKNYVELQIVETYPPHFTPKIVQTPEDYSIIKRFINSAENLSNVRIKEDQI